VRGALSGFVPRIDQHQSAVLKVFGVVNGKSGCVGVCRRSDFPIDGIDRAANLLPIRENLRMAILRDLMKSQFDPSLFAVSVA